MVVVLLPPNRLRVNSVGQTPGSRIGTGKDLTKHEFILCMFICNVYTCKSCISLPMGYMHVHVDSTLQKLKICSALKGQVMIMVLDP